MPPDPPSLLSYEPQVKRPPAPNPLVAALLALPGLACWVMFLCALLTAARVPWLPAPHLSEFILFASLGLWPVAVICALISFARYYRPPRPWYVRLCLAVNITGMLFTFAVIVIVARISR